MNNKDYFFMKRKALDAWKVKKDSLGQLVHGYEKNIYTGMEWVTFENGMIMGNDVKGWYESRGGIQSVWIKQGFESGPLGFPKSDITEQNGIYSQVYEGGVISGNDQIGYSIKK